MAILGKPGDEVEVHIAKSPLDSANPVYFDEYEKLGNPYPSKLECTRYIVPEDGEYVIQITLKKGFDYGHRKGVFVRVHDQVTKEEIGWQQFDKDDGDKILVSDKELRVETLNGVIIDGQKRNNVKLTLQNLVRGNNLLLRFSLAVLKHTNQ